MLVAQVLNLLYNIVDRIYIAHPGYQHGGAGRGGAFASPIIVIITAFQQFVRAAALPLFAIARGQDRAVPG